MGVNIHGVLSRMTDRHGFYSSRATKEFIKRAEEYNPDIIHLHNIHGYYINIKLLFDWLAQVNKPIVWTLHDCWPFTDIALISILSNVKNGKQAAFPALKRMSIRRVCFWILQRETMKISVGCSPL